MFDCPEGPATEQFPKDFCLHETLGKGSNNKVFRVTWNGESCVLRAPRRKSDTQHKASCLWELAHSRHAASLDVGPKIITAWRTRHRKGRWPSGLYMVMEHFPDDLEKLINDENRRDEVIRRRDELGTEICRALQAFAASGMLLYDLKPSNLVVSMPSNGPARVRVIDYGNDFCEWRCSNVPEHARTPTLDLIRDLTAGDKALCEHLIFACMVVQLSSTTARMLHQDRHDTRMTLEDRTAVNPMLPWTATFLDSMQGRNISILRNILRSEDVKGVLQHYQGRRYAGTRRTLRYARDQM